MPADPCLYFLKGEELYVGLYVDDVAAWGSEVKVDWLTNELSKMVELRCLGRISNFIGISFVHRDDGSVEMNQKSYIREMLKEHGMLNSRGVSTTLEPKVKPIREGINEEPVSSTMYRKAIGSLLHLSNCTRPDIAFSVSFLSQKCTNPTVSDWRNVQHLMRYLNNSADMSLVFKKGERKLRSYVDADYANDTKDRR